jgi:tRNA(adenine34) deaminase
MTDSTFDLHMARRCIELSAHAVREGELPFACVVCRDGEVVCETANRVVRDADVTRHAELIAVSDAQRILGTRDLSRCTLYSTVEPCAMCSFPIRETRIRRVVFSISSPMMGGFSKWGVLRDAELSNVMPEAFGDAPEVVAGLLYADAAAVWRKWNPVLWTLIRLHGCLADGSPGDAALKLQSRPAPRGRLTRWLQASFRSGPPFT